MVSHKCSLGLFGGGELSKASRSLSDTWPSFLTDTLPLTRKQGSTNSFSVFVDFFDDRLLDTVQGVSEIDKWGRG